MFDIYWSAAVAAGFNPMPLMNLLSAACFPPCVPAISLSPSSPSDPPPHRCLSPVCLRPAEKKAECGRFFINQQRDTQHGTLDKTSRSISTVEPLESVWRRKASDATGQIV